MTKYLDYHEKIKNEIETVMDDVFEDFKKNALRHGEVDDYIRAFKDVNEGGKRIRGLMIVLGYEMAGGSERKTALKIAAMYEMLQTAILSHDDIIDRSVLRRGKKSLYQELGGEHFGLSQALILGDLGIFWAFSYLAKLNVNEEIKIKLISELGEVMSGTCVGQLQDVHLGIESMPTEELVLSMIYNKTSLYTFIGPLVLGRILAGRFEKDEQILKFAGDLGMAFQIHDDLIGVFSDELESGKTSKSDIKEGKRTLIYLNALKASSSDEKKLLLKYGKSDASAEDIENIKNIFIKTGAKKKVSEKRDMYLSYAEEVVPSVTEDISFRQILLSMISNLKNRTK